MKKIFMAFCLLMVLILAGGAFAEEPAKAPAPAPAPGPGMGPGPGAGPGPGMGRGPGMGPGGGHAMRWWDNPELNLSPQQKTDLEALSQTFQQENAALRNSLMQKRQEVEPLLAEAKLDKEKILAKHKEFISLFVTMEEKRINFEIKQRELLTPEQRAKIGSKKPQPGGPGGPYGPRGGK